MKPDSFTFDRRLFDLLQQEGYAQFTTRELRDAYAKHLEGTSFRLSDVRRYVYDQIRRMLHVGWVVQDVERRKRGQVYHLQPFPERLKLEFVEHGFENNFNSSSTPREEQIRQARDTVLVKVDPDTTQHLESLLKETRLDFLSAMGETERYKQLLDEMPQLKDRLEGEYLEARDRSSRLLGHLRAVEKVLKTFTSKL
ncbi:hypothetical protein SAMN04489798_4973 [Pseudomonas arsenicoxydans]|jgi:hypothetical protein|uniref:Uncharacterized protein n=1 Tax=Pseudomonas arsenicoxydans TaxID=702115 RepID=A0A1H0QQB6_9PSED|nr:hypothetical protein [Pseudomonas arsenicoxydans]SDP19370.1 hypothetical protein SAMN04489798_4973 [Pseudomonas arsenicoxydans]